MHVVCFASKFSIKNECKQPVARLQDGGGELSANQIIAFEDQRLSRLFLYKFVG